MCGTKTTTDTQQHNTINYNPASMNAYNTGTADWSKFAHNQVTNPFGSLEFQTDVTTGTDAGAKIGQRYINNLFQNQRAAGYGNMDTNGFQASMLNRGARYTGGLQAQAMRSAIQNAFSRQWAAAQMQHSYQPLVTGSDMTGHTEQQTSGLGTWLPQVIGAGAGIAAAAMTGGANGKVPASQAGGINSPGFSPGFMGASPGGNFNNSYWGFSNYQSPMQQYNPFAGPNPFNQ